MECPKSLVTGQSATWMEEYSAVRRLGLADLTALPARTAEAFLVLDREMTMEAQDANI